MTKKKHLTIKQILASCKQNLDPPDRLELIFQLLDDLPEHEFGEFAFRLNHPELLRKLYKADTVLTDTMTYRTALRFANEYGLLKAELAKTGRPTTFAGAEFKSFVYERKRNGRTEGEILDDARDKFPNRRISLTYIKKVIQEGNRLGFTRPGPIFRLPSIDEIRLQKRKE